VRHIPAAPSPAAIAYQGEAAIAGVNFLTELDGLLRDAHALREWRVRLSKLFFPVTRLIIVALVSGIIIEVYSAR
jgi:hypothetical protein